tara:strand:- start:2733 stop:3227 length:495 start_codon:yes stop_codon:yes gene_type:complete
LNSILEFVNHYSVLIFLFLLIIGLIYLFVRYKSIAFLILIPLVLLVGYAITNPLGNESNEVELVASGYFSFEKPTVVEFMSPTCMACVASKPTVSAMKEIYGDKVDFIEIDIRDPENMEKVTKYKVRSTPTFIMFDSEGKESFRFSGIAKSRIMQPNIDDIISN